MTVKLKRWEKFLKKETPWHKILLTFFDGFDNIYINITCTRAVRLQKFLSRLIMLEDFLDQVALHAKASKKPGATRRTAPQPNIDPDTLNLGIDLGGDTLKIAFAYYDGSEVRCGKLAPSENVLQIAVPALAFYDSQSKKWFFADQLDTRSSESFVTVVKIKSLLC